MLLEHGGHEVRVAHDGHKALQMARSLLPEFVFLDLGLPDMDGLELARYIRELSVTGVTSNPTIFEQAISSLPICCPARATLLTGLIPSQHGVHNYLTAGQPQLGPRAYSTIAELRSLRSLGAAARAQGRSPGARCRSRRVASRRGGPCSAATTS